MYVFCSMARVLHPGAKRYLLASTQTTTNTCYQPSSKLTCRDACWLCWLTSTDTLVLTCKAASHSSKLNWQQRYLNHDLLCTRPVKLKLLIHHGDMNGHDHINVHSVNGRSLTTAIEAAARQIAQEAAQQAAQIAVSLQS